MPACHAVSSRSRASAAALLVTLALAAGGCSSSDSSSPKSSPPGVAGSSPAVATSKLVLGKVAGTIRKKDRKVFKRHRKTMLKQVRHAVDTWVDGGFVGVDYPRDSFGTAFRAFTEPAKRDARRQKRLTTNWNLRKKIDGVDVKKRVVTVDVLAPRGRPAGVTARVDLVFTTSGDTTQRVTVRGRLFLSPGHGHWRIFGYDVSRGVR